MIDIHGYWSVVAWIVSLACGLAGAVIWDRKGGDPVGAFVVAALLNLLGLLILAVSSPRQREVDRVARRRAQRL